MSRFGEVVRIALGGITLGALALGGVVGASNPEIRERIGESLQGDDKTVKVSTVVEPTAEASDDASDDPETTVINGIDIHIPAFEKMVGIAIFNSAQQFDGMSYGPGGHGNIQSYLKRIEDKGVKSTTADCSGLISGALQDIGEGTTTWTVAGMVNDDKNFDFVKRSKAIKGDITKRGTVHAEIFEKQKGGIITTYGAHRPGSPAGELRSKRWDSKVLRYVGYKKFKDQEHLKVFIENVITLNPKQ